MSKTLKITFISIGGVFLSFFLLCAGFLVWGFSPSPQPDTSKYVIARNCREFGGRKRINFDLSYDGKWQMKLKDLPVKFSDKFLQINNLTPESEVPCGKANRDRAEFFGTQSYEIEKYIKSDIYIERENFSKTPYKTFKSTYTNQNVKNREYLNFSEFKVKIPESNSYLELYGDNLDSAYIVSYKDFQTKDGKTFHIILKQSVEIPRINQDLKAFFDEKVKDKFDCFEKVCGPRESELENIYSIYEKELFENILFISGFSVYPKIHSNFLENIEVSR